MCGWFCRGEIGKVGVELHCGREVGDVCVCGHYQLDGGEEVGIVLQEDNRGRVSGLARGEGG